jgi:hypothetical protein
MTAIASALSRQVQGHLAVGDQQPLRYQLVVKP